MPASGHSTVLIPPPAGFVSRPGRNGPERRNLASRDLLIRRVRSEFEEMPGLRLTFEQALVLFDLEPACCERVLGALQRSGFLVRTKSGHFGRRDLTV